MRTVLEIHHCSHRKGLVRGYSPDGKQCWLGNGKTKKRGIWTLENHGKHYIVNFDGDESKLYFPWLGVEDGFGDKPVVYHSYSSWCEWFDVACSEKDDRTKGEEQEIRLQKAYAYKKLEGVVSLSNYRYYCGHRDWLAAQHRRL